MAKLQKVTISERALLARINRKLKQDNEQVRKCKVDSRSYWDLGSYYVIDLSKNAVTATHVDLSKWGRELKVLADFEVLES